MMMMMIIIGRSYKMRHIDFHTIALEKRAREREDSILNHSDKVSGALPSQKTQETHSSSDRARYATYHTF
jgi:hypothetical protein